MHGRMLVASVQTAEEKRGVGQADWSVEAASRSTKVHRENAVGIARTEEEQQRTDGDEERNCGEGGTS